MGLTIDIGIIALEPVIGFLKKIPSLVGQCGGEWHQAPRVIFKCIYMFTVIARFVLN